MRIFRWVTVGALISGLAIPLGARAGAASPSAYQVTIQRTPGGIPHITGANFDGEFNAIYQDVVNTQGQDPSIGSSYIQAVTWHAGGACPDAQTIMTYSESTNATSPYYDDQTLLFSNKQWMPEYFCSSAVDAHTISRSELRGTASSG